MDPSQTVSELSINYSSDFTQNNVSLLYTYSVERANVVKDYKIDRRDPLSPVKTVLSDVADCENLAIEIMETSKQPERKIEVQIFEILDLQIFDIIGIDTGLFNETNIEYGEILNIEPDYINKRQKITIRVIPDYIK